MKITELSAPGFELVKHAIDKNSGLDAIIAIHSTRLGPAVGGLRMEQYKSLDDMLTQAKMLAEAMTYKCAVAGLDYGGGKCIMNFNPKEKTTGVLEDMGEFISNFNGMIYTGTDSNITVDDLEAVKRRCQYLIGTKEKSGDPAPQTALGVYEGITACLDFLYHDKSLKNHVAFVQGIGKVGSRLASMLYKECKSIIIAETKEENITIFKSEHPYVRMADPNDFWKDEKFDIFVPCVTYDPIDMDRIDMLNAAGCRIIAGSTNCQLENDITGLYLKHKGILYAPDFVINAGGLLSVVSELASWPREELIRRVRGIGKTVSKVLNMADKENIQTDKAAKMLAEERLAKAT